jgi:peptide/nickel transport system substrate-binding protein
MKRLFLFRFTLLAAVAAAIGLAVACGGEEPAPTATTAPQAQPTATQAPAPTATATARPAPTNTPVPPTPTSGPVKGGTLKIASVGSVQSFDPNWTTASATHNVTHSIQEMLLTFTDDYQLGKQLIDTWSSSADGLTWTFKIRSGVKFHDGTPLTTKQVLATINRQKDAAAVFKLVKAQFGPEKHEDFIKGVDDLTFTMHVKEATGLVPFTLGPQNFQPLIQTEAWAAVPQKESAKGDPIGTGPYKFEKWTPGDRWSMVRFDGYSPSKEKSDGTAGAQVAYFDRVEYIEIPDQTTRVAALEAGEVDMAQEFPADLAARLEKNPKIQLVPQAPFRLLGHFNHIKQPFNNLEARKAFIQAYDNEKALLLATGDKNSYKLCPSLMQCGTAWESSAGAAGNYAVKKTAESKAKIAALGLAGTKVRLMDPTDRQPAHAAAQVSREVLADIGFNVEYLVMDWATMVTRRADPELWEFFHTWSGSSVRTGPVGHLAFGELQYNGWFNKYQDLPGKQRDLLAKLAKETDVAKQKQIMDDFQAYFYEDAIFLQVGEFFVKWAARADMQGIVPASPAAQLPANKWIKK